MTKIVRWALSGALATLLWMPNAHRLASERTTDDDDATCTYLAAPFVSSLPPGEPSPKEMRRDNPEWDLMGRLYLGLALADRVIAHPDDRASRAALDAVVDDTDRAVATEGQGAFMLPYKDAKPWIWSETRSLFVDGEVLMMQAARAVAEDSPPPPSADDRAKAIVRSMRASPTLSGESYPDEAWVFCNTTALAALAIYDAAPRASNDSAAAAADAREHDALARDWLALAKTELVEPKTGLLVSSFKRDGRVDQGPEGSTIYMSAHNLRYVDDAFAHDQWSRAKSALVRDVLGFTYSEEWPAQSHGAYADIDSGPVVPIFDASPGASGLAILGARAFGDDETSRGLERSLSFVAFPERDEHGHVTHHLAGNRLGDAIVVYGRGFGPLFEKTRAKRAPQPKGAAT